MLAGNAVRHTSDGAVSIKDELLHLHDLTIVWPGSLFGTTDRDF
jgi:hypothetical protein